MAVADPNNATLKLVTVTVSRFTFGPVLGCGSAQTEARRLCSSMELKRQPPVIVRLDRYLGSAPNPNKQTNYAMQMQRANESPNKRHVLFGLNERPNENESFAARSKCRLDRYLVQSILLEPYSL
jgi:hypothetical protein